MGERLHIFSILKEQKYAGLKEQKYAGFYIYIWSITIFNKVRELIELFISNTNIVFR